MAGAELYVAPNISHTASPCRLPSHLEADQNCSYHTRIVQFENVVKQKRSVVTK